MQWNFLPDSSTTEPLLQLPKARNFIIQPFTHTLENFQWLESLSFYFLPLGSSSVLWISVLFSWGYHNGLSNILWLTTTEMYFLIVLEAGSPQGHTLSEGSVVVCPLSLPVRHHSRLCFHGPTAFSSFLSLLWRHCSLDLGHAKIIQDDLISRSLSFTAHTYFPNKITHRF